MADKTTTKKTVKPATEVKTIEQLHAELLEKQTAQIVAKRSHASGDLVNPRVLTAARKEIARLHFAIRAQELAAAKESK